MNSGLLVPPGGRSIVSRSDAYRAAAQAMSCPARTLRLLDPPGDDVEFVL
jgi:hypothetical protein